MASSLIADTTPVEVRRRIIDRFRRDVDFDQMPLEAWELLDQGLTLGIFQIEDGSKAKDLAKQTQPRSVEDLAVISALNRPGPLRSGDANRFVSRRQHPETIEYPHAIVEDILQPTLGVFVYQEQVIAYFSKIGYSLGEADHIRKIIGKKLVDQMQLELPRYMERAEKYMSTADAKSMWELVVNYSKYGFNKAHAVAYGMITAWTIYCKWRWRVPFYMASIDKHPKKTGSYMAEARRRGIKVAGPDYNKSGVLISSDGEGGIVFGLSNIKGLKAAAVQIVETQPYASPEDFVARAPVNLGIKKLMMRAGTCDSAGYRMGICRACEGKGRVPDWVPKKKGDGLKRVLVDCKCEAGWVQEEIPSLADRMAAERELYDIILTDFASDIFASNPEALQDTDTFATLADDRPGTIRVPGIIDSITEGRVKTGPGTGKPWVRAEIQDLDGSVRPVWAWSDVLEKFGYGFKENKVAIFTIKGGRDKRGDYKFTLKALKVLLLKETVEASDNRTT